MNQSFGHDESASCEARRLENLLSGRSTPAFQIPLEKLAK